MDDAHFDEIFDQIRDSKAFNILDFATLKEIVLAVKSIQLTQEQTLNYLYKITTMAD